jgi:hypothetical protein
LAGHDVSEPKDFLFSDERLEGAIGMGVSDEEVKGVAPQVKSGNPHDLGL